MTKKTMSCAIISTVTSLCTHQVNADTSVDLELETSVVNAEQQPADLEAAIQTEILSANSKILGPIVETPRSVSLVSQKQILERGAQNIQESLNYTAGVFASPFGLDTRIDDPRVRGLTPLKFRDGFQSNFRFYNTARAEIYATETVEVIKGASSVLFGQGSLGGIVNATSKRPKEIASRELNVQYGSNSRRQAAFDFTGPIGESDTLFYRLIGMKRESDTQVDYVPDDALLLMPSLTWKPSDATKLTLMANFQDNESGSSAQFIENDDPQLAGVDIGSNDFFGQPDFDKYDTDRQSYSLFFEHEIDDTFTFNFNTNYARGSADYRYIQSLPTALVGGFGLPNPAAGSLYASAYRDESSSSVWSNNASLKADFNTGSVKHQATFGIDYVDAKTDSNRPTSELGVGFRGYNILWTGAPFFSLPQAIDFTNPAYDLDIANSDYDQKIEQQIKQLGLRIGDVMEFDDWTLSMGVRYDKVKQKHDRNYDIAGVERSKSNDDSEFTFDAGVMYQFENGISPYYSYSEAFEAQDVDFTTGESFDPRTGKQHELGFKYQSESGNTLITAAVFDIEESNRLVSVNGFSNTPVDASYTGFELEVQHKIEDFYFLGSVTTTRAKTGSKWSDDPTIGSHLPNVPDKQANVWIGYAPESGKLKNFRAGLGGRYIGETYSTSNDLSTDSQVLADAMIGYRIGNIDLQLNANNLFDKEYVAAFSETATGIGQFWGARRTVNLTATYKF